MSKSYEEMNDYERYYYNMGKLRIRYGDLLYHIPRKNSGGHWIAQDWVTIDDQSINNFISKANELEYIYGNEESYNAWIESYDSNISISFSFIVTDSDLIQKLEAFYLDKYNESPY